MQHQSNQPLIVQNVVVLGGGTAGYLTALALKRRAPQVHVRVLQSSKLGIIGVGEGSLRQLPPFLHQYLDIDPARFYREVNPTWKLGIRFAWGPRENFMYSFAPQLDVIHPHPDLPKPIGYYCFDDMADHCVASVLMHSKKVFLRDRQGGIEIGDDVGYHLDNKKFAGFLEAYAVEQGICIIDDLVVDVQLGDKGVRALTLESGEQLEADLFVDCSGFVSLLLGKNLQEPFVGYRSSLFCDSAVIGGWKRTEEPILPYTTSETMSAGWCWQIEHEEKINRGYVYSSDFISDEAAEQEFRAKAPDVDTTNVVRFKSGRYERAWVKNVVAIGNSAGFVEPLEATAIAAVCSAAKALAETLAATKGIVGDAVKREFNSYNARSWDTIADFLSVHYKFNQRIDSEFWRACLADVDLRGAAPIVDFYRAEGPSQLWRLTLEDPVCRFKLDGYYTLLVGQQVLHARLNDNSPREWTAWTKLKAATRRYCEQSVSVADALQLVKSADWQWQTNHFRSA